VPLCTRRNRRRQTGVCSSEQPAAGICALIIEDDNLIGRKGQHWCGQLGASHRRRDDSARGEASALRDRDAERQQALRRRWPAIAAAIRALVTSYNDGAGIEVLTVVDYTHSDRRDLILEVIARGGQRLTMEVAGAELWVRPNEGTAGAPDGGRRWLTLSLTDEDAAAYALQHWLTQL
jgi:hypothetical protein